MTLVKLAFIPANELSPASSVVPDDRTATATSVPRLRVDGIGDFGWDGGAIISSCAAHWASISEMGSSTLSPPSCRASRARA